MPLAGTNVVGSRDVKFKNPSATCPEQEIISISVSIRKLVHIIKKVKYLSLEIYHHTTLQVSQTKENAWSGTF